MTESYILHYAPLRVKELGYTRHMLRYRDLVIDGENIVNIPAYNELFFIVDDPPGLIVESDYGMYDSTDDPLPDNVHEHRGEITIHNPGTGKRKIKFIQVIIVS
ncbi:hypothetical protein [Ohtaekwangia koreensis]|uniref:Uncharacterized protein n=1 Tax=Ohtaekwangia koreensis TaxID=688867 RepID=A0A1T5J793_9BACT|nr:hypothetical protein [Ohtaekwangia koreensis]SKC47285.1 hypothetical protein SAMN05660236_0834 [Ohtaekwangia koreensis]